MALEDLVGLDKFLDALVITNPTLDDPVSQGDDHVRGVKNTLINSFGAMSGLMIFPAAAKIADGAGSAALPHYAFSPDTNTGMFRVATDVLGFSTGGVEKARIESRKRGHSVAETALADGSIKLTIQVQGGAA